LTGKKGNVILKNSDFLIWVQRVAKIYTEAFMEEAKPEDLRQEVAVQAKDLLQEQLSNLSARLFEAGKRGDQQLTTWMIFTALTPLILFGASGNPRIGGVELNPLLAGAVTYILSCVFYYRAILSNTALGYWRSFLRQHRRERFAVFYQVARNISAGEHQRQIERELDGYVSEYPGYIACSVLVKDEALKKKRLFGKYITFVYKFIILVFTVSPYALAVCLLYTSWFSWWYIGTTVFGLIITISGNVILQQQGDS
jgi:hypothetical protein